MKAYLDIETSFERRITVVGIYNESDKKVVQLVGRDITKNNILKTLKGISILYTYNGHRFDIPFIERELSMDIKGSLVHVDLMFSCWKNNLYGGLKEVEKKLGIKRELVGVDGYQAMVLWKNYSIYNDIESLDTLLKYNKEDLVNLFYLRKILELKK